jgi:hypothetical protein
MPREAGLVFGQLLGRTFTQHRTATRAALWPGTVYADPYGHVLVLVKWVPPGPGRGGLLLAAGPLLWLVVSYGAWNLRPWAWWAGMAATGITVVGVVVNIINGVGILQAMASAPLSIVIFIYLLLPDIRRVFGVGSA